jgi:hypothetical protein
VETHRKARLQALAFALDKAKLILRHQARTLCMAPRCLFTDPAACCLLPVGCSCCLPPLPAACSSLCSNCCWCQFPATYGLLPVVVCGRRWFPLLRPPAAALAVAAGSFSLCRRRMACGRHHRCECCLKLRLWSFSGQAMSLWPAEQFPAWRTTQTSSTQWGWCGAASRATQVSAASRPLAGGLADCGAGTWWR